MYCRNCDDFFKFTNTLRKPIQMTGVATSRNIHKYGHMPFFEGLLECAACVFL